MKAVILAAGTGSRLGEITRQLPKPMIEVAGKPILAHNIDLCRNSGISEICINLHHLPNIIKDYFGDGTEFGVKINYNYEPSLLGTAGALLPFKDILKNGPFFVIYGDNFVSINLMDLKYFNEKMNSDISILFHWRNDVGNSGVAEFSLNSRIRKFIEKPTQANSNGDWVNAGIYFIQTNSIMELINKKDDFAEDIFPKLLNMDYNIYGFKTKADLVAIDTPQLLSENSKNFENNI